MSFRDGDLRGTEFVPGDWLEWAYYSPGSASPDYREVRFLSWLSPIRAQVLYDDKQIVVHRRNLDCVKGTQHCTIVPVGTVGYNGVMAETPTVNFRIPVELLEKWKEHAKSMNMTLTQYLIQCVRLGDPALMHALSFEDDKSHLEDR